MMDRSQSARGPLASAAALVAIAMLAGAGETRAALLAYEPFAFGDPPAQGQYALGDEDLETNLLGGQNPLIGPTPFYGGAWVQSGGDSQVVKARRSLFYPDLTPGLGGIQQETLQFDCCSFGRSGRPIAGGLGFGSARNIYQSFLIDFGSQGTDAAGEFGLRGHKLWNGGVGDASQAVRLYVNSFDGTDDLTLSVTTTSGDSSEAVGSGDLDLVALDGVHLVVMKYQFHPLDPDVVSVFLDPVAGAPEPGSADAQISVAASDLFITHHGAFTNFTFSGSGHTPGTIDEIRWGDSFADVTPVPEPAAPLLLGIAVATLLGLRRTTRRAFARIGDSPSWLGAQESVPFARDHRAELRE
jgi:hypothetical protein